MKERDFLSFLVDETLKLHNGRDLQLQSLELKLMDYGLIYLKGEFVPQLKILRFETPFGLVDIPINWSIFSSETVSSIGHIVCDKNDDDHLLKILKTAWAKEIEKILITHADGFCYIVGLKIGDENYVHDLLSPTEFLDSA